MSSTSRLLSMVNTKDIFNPSDTPAWAKDLMVEGYEKAKRDKSSQSYQCIGYPIYHFKSNGHQLDSDTITDGYIKIKGIDKSKVKVGDFGAGNNRLIEALNERGIPGVGLSATDYKSETKLANYIVTNGEFVSDVSAFNDIDIIFTKMTTRHIRNVAKVICDLYRALKPGGVLVIDELCFPGMDGWHRDLIDYLRKSGYEISTTYQSLCSTFPPSPHGLEKLTGICIAKTKPELLLPLQYDQVVKNEINNSCAGYKPSELLKAFRKLNEEEEIKDTEVEEKKSSDEISSHYDSDDETFEFDFDELDPEFLNVILHSETSVDQSLIDLFQKPEYKEMAPDEQSKEIKDIVLKMTKKEQEENLAYLKENLNDKYLELLFNVTHPEYPPCKLALYAKLHHKFIDSPRIALAQIKYLATLEIEADRELAIQKDFCKKHFGIEPEKFTERLDANQAQIMPPVLLQVQEKKEETERSKIDYNFIHSIYKDRP